ncbi:MAG: DUF1015 domain-containing protein, partial [Desulfobacterales bacterium]|nr:DUF1015 domain-containing protein [Desulfobacterales bacterium]
SQAGQYILLKLREDVNHEFWRSHMQPPLQKLDVIVLTELILKELLNVDEATLNDETRIRYRHDAFEAVEQVDRGLFQVAFLINQTRIEQLQE